MKLWLININGHYSDDIVSVIRAESKEEAMTLWQDNHYLSIGPEDIEELVVEGEKGIVASLTNQYVDRE